MNFGLECEWTLGGDPLEGMFANCTHIIVGLLKALRGQWPMEEYLHKR